MMKPLLAGVLVPLVASLVLLAAMGGPVRAANEVDLQVKSLAKDGHVHV